jgi:hypothetical protein
MNLSPCPSEFIFEPVTLSEAAALLLVVILLALGNAALDPCRQRGREQRTRRKTKDERSTTCTRTTTISSRMVRAQASQFLVLPFNFEPIPNLSLCLRPISHDE